ncbi:MAG: SdrD B-like domain-containing protein, partial [Planctomycetota bacterium]
GYKIEHQDAASGDELIKLSCNTGYARLPSFGGESCVYDLEITVIDENDGEGLLDVFVDGEFVGCFQLNQNNNGNGVSDVSFSTLTLKGVEIPQGAEITFKGRADDYEFIRIDKIEFCKVEFRECDDPDAVNIGFDNFVAGEKITDQLDGITISASGGSGDAMIFDSGAAQASGGDSDLLTMKQGNVLIVSEDGDMSDPDDAVGGTICIEFDNPAKVFDLKVVDTEEGGTITAVLADGSTVEIEIPSIANGGVAQVLIDLEDVTKLTIELDGSGAIDDLCYVPGAPQLGSLSGRYFCDENGDGLDNDNLNDGVGGILVELLNADGSGTGMTTTTDEFGNYAFTDLVPGTYGVKFTDTTGATDGKALTTTDVDGNANDDIDSDAVGDNVMSTISGIEVVGGQDTPDNDAGVEELGSLSGRYFCDENR